MRKLVLAAVCVSLGGCATLPPKVDKVIHRHHRAGAHKAVPVAAPAAPAAAPEPVQAVPPVLTPEKPKSFLQRHPIQWLH